MKKWTAGEALLFCAAVLAVACAILLPPSLSLLADHRLEEAQYTVQAETLDVSLVYQMSTAQRLALLARAGEESVLTFTDGQPAQDELTAEQAVVLCQEELDRLYELGVLPGRFSLSDSDASSARYTMLCDRDDRQRSVSLWALSTSKDSGYDFGYACTLVMDAQTGLIYSLRLVLDGMPEFSLEDAAYAWGTYLELGAPTVQEKYEVPPSAGETDTVSWVGLGLQSLSALYETDEGAITCSFKLDQNPDPKLPTTSITITPVFPSSSG